MNATIEDRLAWLTPRTANGLGFLWCAGLMAYALFVQYGLHEEPCPLCIFQRVSVLCAGAVFLVATLHDPKGFFRKVYGLLILVATVFGMVVAARHVWIIAQPPGTVAECGASLDYMMDVLPLHEVLGKVLSGSGECAKVTWRLFGLSMPVYVFLNLAGLSALAFYGNFLRRR